MFRPCISSGKDKCDWFNRPISMRIASPLETTPWSKFWKDWRQNWKDWIFYYFLMASPSPYFRLISFRTDPIFSSSQDSSLYITDWLLDQTSVFAEGVLLLAPAGPLQGAATRDLRSFWLDGYFAGVLDLPLCFHIWQPLNIITYRIASHLPRANYQNPSLS